MDRSTFLITVFCLIDDWLTGQRVRQRGPPPIPYDSEILTIEVGGAFFGLATDEAIYAFFCQYYPDYFSRLRAVDRTTFTWQAANLWGVKQQLWQYLLTRVAHDPALSIIDSCPLPVCQSARARRLRQRTNACGRRITACASGPFGQHAHLLARRDRRLQSRRR